MNTMTKTPKERNTETALVSLKPGEMITIAIDAHKVSYDCAIYSRDQRRILKTWHMPADYAGLLKMTAPLREHTFRIGYEAGPTGFGLARFLKDNGFNVHVIPPSAIEQPPGRRAKSDRIDARKLSIVLDNPDLSAVYVPSVEEEDARDAFRNRDQLCCKIRRVKAQIKSHLLRWGVAEPEGLRFWSRDAVAALKTIDLPPNAHRQIMTRLVELEHLKVLRSEATTQMNRVVAERHQRAAKHLQSIPGVGPITLSAFLLELPPMSKIDSRRALAKLIGLSPLRRGSGQVMHEFGREPGGKRRLRSLLIEAAWIWQAKDPEAQAIFNRISRGIPIRRKKAATALARRLAIIMRRLIIEDRPYQSRETKV